MLRRVVPNAEFIAFYLNSCDISTSLEKGRGGIPSKSHGSITQGKTLTRSHHDSAHFSDQQNELGS